MNNSFINLSKNFPLLSAKFHKYSDNFLFIIFFSILFPGLSLIQITSNSILNSGTAFGGHVFALLIPYSLSMLFLCLITLTDSNIAIFAAWIHPFLRFLYICAYVFNIPTARGLMWASGIFTTLLLYKEGLTKLI